MVRRPRRLGDEIELRAQESKLLPLPRPELLRRTHSFICEPSSVDDLRECTRSLTQDLAREVLPGSGPRGAASHWTGGGRSIGADCESASLYSPVEVLMRSLGSLRLIMPTLLLDPLPTSASDMIALSRRAVGARSCPAAVSRGSRRELRRAGVGILRCARDGLEQLHQISTTSIPSNNLDPGCIPRQAHRPS